MMIQLAGFLPCLNSIPRSCGGGVRRLGSVRHAGDSSTVVPATGGFLGLTGL